MKELLIIRSPEKRGATATTYYQAHTLPTEYLWLYRAWRCDNPITNEATLASFLGGVIQLKHFSEPSSLRQLDAWKRVAAHQNKTTLVVPFSVQPNRLKIPNSAQYTLDIQGGRG